MGDLRALLERLVHDLLGANDLSTTPALVCGDNDLRLGVYDTVAQGVGGEAGEDDRVNGADTGAGKEGDDRLGNHGQVQRNGVALLDAHLLQHVGQSGDLAQELAVGDGAALIVLVGLVDDGRLVGIRDGVTVNAVVRGIEAALEEPGVVAVLEAAGVDGLEVALPGQELACPLAPELVRLLDRLLVQLLVVVEALEMRFCWVLPAKVVSTASVVARRMRAC